MHNLYHPKDTAKLMRNHANQADHLAYRIHFNQMKSHHGKKSFERVHPLNREVIPSQTMRNFTNRLHQRQALLWRQSAPGHLCKFLLAKTSGRFIHGIGNTHVRESHLTVHPVYGIPYIPASSIKGALRNWVKQSIFGGSEPAEIKQEMNVEEKVFFDLFGTQSKRGLLLMDDAFAVGGFTVSPDVLTPHFQDYYSSQQPPTDNIRPQTTDFYTVDDTQFQFKWAIDHKFPAESGYEKSELLDLTLIWLKNMLETTGLGAKTSVGYGRFKEVNDITPEINQQWEQWKQEEQRKLQQKEKQRKQKEWKERLAAMSESERLVYEIEELGNDDQDIQQSKGELYNRVQQFAEQGDITPAKALKTYWEKIGEWHVKKNRKKQFQKVTYLQNVILSTDKKTE